MPSPRPALAVLLLALTTPTLPAQPVDRDDLASGLVAVYRDPPGASAAAVSRLDPIPTLNLAAGEASHPRLSAAIGGTAHWTGYLTTFRPGEYRFSAMLRGRVTVTVAGRPVLSADVTGERAEAATGPVVKLDAGALPLTIEFARPAGAARLELRWQGPGFRSETPAAARFGHLPSQASAELQRDTQADRGRLLFEERGCANCHRPAEGDRLGAGLLKRQGPDLRQVGGRVYAGWLYQWLLDPTKLRPATPMPRLFADTPQGRAEAYAVARYLSGPLKPAPTFTFSREERQGAERGRQAFVRIGCGACHAEQANGGANYPLGNIGNKTAPQPLAHYLRDPLAICPDGRMPSLTLQPNEALDLARFLCRDREAGFPSELPSEPSEADWKAAWKALGTEVPAELTREPSEARWRTLARTLIVAKGCVNCHQIERGADADTRAFTRLAALPAVHNRGCLTNTPPALAADYHLSADDREALQTFLTHGLTGAGSPAPAFQARAALTRFRCLNCHQRDGQGGLSPELVEQLRQVEKAENQDAVTPPVLTGVGHKLLTPWLREVLTAGGRARPWMGLRMPQFGAGNVAFLAEGLARLEGADPQDRPDVRPLTAQKVADGRRLIARGGFSCISCHDIAGQPNSGTRGPDLATTTRRVRYGWYRDWLEQPQRMVPGTRMPQVFVEGKSTLPTVCDGNTDAQAEAMWAYCSLGPGLPLPEGLEAPKGLILAARERPELLRTFLPDVGSRGIAIGYPGGVSVAFDANRCRLAYAWSGLFLDASPVWNDRGGAPAKVLGVRFWSAPPGFPWALTAGPDLPDFATLSRDPALGAPVPEGQLAKEPRRLFFDGYATNADGWPTFRYHLQAGPAALSVQERPEPLRGAVAAGVARRFTIEGPAGQTAWLWAGTAAREPRRLTATGATAQLELKAGAAELTAANTRFVLPLEGERAAVLAAVGVPADARWLIRRDRSGWQVLLRLPAGSQRTFTVRVWGLARDVPELLKGLAVEQ